jgi:5-hydroxyisourate hydrolase
MSTLSTHILDIAAGRPAADILVILFHGDRELARARTNPDGRIAGWSAELPPGTYKLLFETKSYFDRQSTPTLYPFIEIAFAITTDTHYHIPLLLSPFGYSTYRGS